MASKKARPAPGFALLPAPRRRKTFASSVLSPREKQTQDFLQIAEKAWKEAQAEPPLLTRGQRSKWGLPKNTVQSFLDLPVSAETKRWLKARNKYDCLILDALDAHEAGLIDARTLRAERSKIAPRYEHADANFQASFARDQEKATRAALPTHRAARALPPSKPRPRKRSR